MRAARPSSTTCSAAGCRRVRACSSPAPPARANPCSSTQYACAAAARGERVRFYLFDERLSTFRLRAEGLGMELERAARTTAGSPSGRSSRRELSPGEFANEVVRARRGGRRADGRHRLDQRLHAVDAGGAAAARSRCTSCSAISPTAASRCIMTLVQRGIFGSPVDEAAEVSYLADTVLLLRYFEVQRRRAAGDLRREEAQRQPRAHDPRVPRGARRAARRRAAARVPGRAHRRAALRRRRRPTHANDAEARRVDRLDGGRAVGSRRRRARPERVGSCDRPRDADWRRRARSPQRVLARRRTRRRVACADIVGVRSLTRSATASARCSSPRRRSAGAARATCSRRSRSSPPGRTCRSSC